MAIEEPKTVKVNSIERFEENCLTLEGLLQNLNDSPWRADAVLYKRGNVNENSSPSTESGGSFLTSSKQACGEFEVHDHRGGRIRSLWHATKIK